MQLKRSLSLPLISFYGLGTILGAGIYALIGEVSKKAESFTPVAFFIASILALFTAVSYAELCSRYPQSAGSALYVQRAFNISWLSGLVGWLVVLTGVVSAATISHGFSQYFALFFSIPTNLNITLLVLLLGGLAIWGIHESAILIMAMTLIEIGGLLLIIFYGSASFDLSNTTQLTMPRSVNGIVIGAFIAFYAYIGFEDMVNTSEETINPQRNLPIAIFIAVLGASVLYGLVSWVVVKTLPASSLASSTMPLVDIVKIQGHSPTLFIVIALVAIANGLLVQIIMASRLIYGMAKQKNAPRVFSTIYGKTQTPVYATLLVMGIILLFAYALPIATLAKLTSSIMLCIFITIHSALIKIKFTEKLKPQTFTAPVFFPFFSLLLSVAFLLAQFL